MEQDLGEPLKVLKVDGGASANNLLMQLQSDLLNRDIVRPTMTDTTALGSALLAGLACGIFKDLNAIRDTWQADAHFSPAMEPQARDAMLALWQEGLKRV